MGMPRSEIEFEFDMVFCFGIHLAPSFRPFVRSQFMNEGP